MKNFRLYLVLLALFSLSALSSNAAQLASAKVISVSGIVNVSTAGSAETPLKTGSILTQGDSISTNSSSTILLVFSNGSELTIKENSHVTLAELTQEAFGGTKRYEQLKADPSRSQTLLKLNYGKVNGHVKTLSNGSKFFVETPLGTAAIRGTHYIVAFTSYPAFGLYTLKVSNLDGQVDLITKVGDSTDAKTYDSEATETSTPIPAGEDATVTISKDDPNFESVIDVKKNTVPAKNTAPAAPEITPEDNQTTIISPNLPG